MQDTLLVINCGSSSLKFALFDKDRQKIASFTAGRLNTPEPRIRIAGQREVIPLPPNANHRDALSVLVDIAKQRGLMPARPTAIGHRVVHGGETFREAVIIDDKALAAIAACGAADKGLGQVVDAVLRRGGAVLVIADHGNAEQMLEPDGSPHTAHTTNPVPCVLICDDPLLKRSRLREGGVLGDVSPTVLELMGLAQPSEMTGKSLIES